MRRSYRKLKRGSAAGIDGETWKECGKNLGDNLKNLSERLRKGAYRARAVKRTYIPKGDGRQRPIGIPVLEDKIVQISHQIRARETDLAIEVTFQRHGMDGNIEVVKRRM